MEKLADQALAATERPHGLIDGGNGVMSRAEQLRSMSPQLIADVTLYRTAEGGRRSSALPGWGCPCCLSKETPIVAAYDAWPLLGDMAIHPGESRRVGFVFLSGEETANLFRSSGKFFLWEGGFIGEAIVVLGASAATSPPGSFLGHQRGQ
jgi:hypothetical protein